MISIEAAFERIFEEIMPVLVKGGFSEVERKNHPEAFGSRFITFGDEKELIRLTWDGKNEWFVLESISLSSMIFESGWADILLQLFKPRSDGIEVVENIARDMRDSLLDYLEVTD